MLKVIFWFVVYLVRIYLLAIVCHNCVFPYLSEGEDKQ